VARRATGMLAHLRMLVRSTGLAASQVDFTSIRRALLKAIVMCVRMCRGVGATVASDVEERDAIQARASTFAFTYWANAVRVLVMFENSLDGKRGASVTCLNSGWHLLGPTATTPHQ